MVFRVVSSQKVTTTNIDECTEQLKRHTCNRGIIVMVIIDPEKIL